MIVALWIVGMAISFIADKHPIKDPRAAEQVMYTLWKLGGWFLLNCVMVSVLEFIFELKEKSGFLMSTQKKVVFVVGSIVINAAVLLWLFPLEHSQLQALIKGEFASVVWHNVVYLVSYVIFVVCFMLSSVGLLDFKRSKRILFLWGNLLSIVIMMWFFSMVIIAGFSIAMGAIHLFFMVDAFRFLPYIFASTTLLFAPLKGLSLLPESEKMLAADLKVSTLYNFFTHKIAAIIVLFYLVLLYVFAAQQMIIWQWPRYSIVLSILGLLIPVVLLNILVFPDRYKEIHSKYDFLLQRGVNLLSVPMVMMYLFSIGLRINQYGFTIPRYLTMIFGVWLLVFNLYWGMVKKQRLIIIPALVVLLTAVSVLTPFLNMYDLSLRSQVGRLEKKLTEAKLLNSNKMFVATAFNADQSLSKDTMNVVDFSAVQYLKRNHLNQKLVDQRPYLKVLTNYSEYSKTFAKTGVQQPVVLSRTFEADQNNDTFQPDGSMTLFTDPLELYSKATSQLRNFKTKDGRLIYLSVSMSDSKNILVTNQGRSTHLLLDPLYQALLPSLTAASNAQAYQREKFPSYVNRVVAGEDENFQYQFYVSQISMEVPPRNGAVSVDSIKLNSLSGFLMVREK